MALKIGALFAGYGGLEMGVREVLPDAEVAWVSELDPAPSKILAHNLPGVPNLGDITQIDWSQVEPVDIITGGSPCQDLSTAGKRAGMKEGTRSGLWSSMLEAIKVAKPSLVIWENVRGALSAEGEPVPEEVTLLEARAYAISQQVEALEVELSAAKRNGDHERYRKLQEKRVRALRHHDRAMGEAQRIRRGLVRAIGRVTGDLADIGYNACWTGLRAADIGAPHGRWRIFVIAWPADTESYEQRESAVAQLRPEPRHGIGYLTLLPTPNAYEGRWGGSQRPDKKRAGGHQVNLGDVAEHHLLRTPCAQEAGGGPCHPEVAKANNQTLRLTGQVLAATGNLADPRGAYADTWGDYGPAIARWEPIIGRDAPAPTEASKTGKQVLSPHFVEWMMGLPAGWVTDPAIAISRNDQLKALGNGVVPQQAAAAIAWGIKMMHKVKGD